MSKGDEILPPSFAFYGILMIILGIITWIITFGYVVPTGSIFLIGSGIFVLCARKHGRNKNREVHNT